MRHRTRGALGRRGTGVELVGLTLRRGEFFTKRSVVDEAQRVAKKR